MGYEGEKAGDAGPQRARLWRDRVEKRSTRFKFELSS